MVANIWDLTSTIISLEKATFTLMSPRTNSVSCLAGTYRTHPVSAKNANVYRQTTDELMLLLFLHKDESKNEI